MSQNKSCKFVVNAGASTPVKATKYAACYDLSAHLYQGRQITVYSNKNVKTSRAVRITGCLFSQNESGVTAFVNIGAGQRALIPTGIRTSMPQNFSLRLHPRSGLAIKNGIQLANCQGVVDADYTNEIFAAVLNTSDQMFTIRNGDRICQAQFVKNQVQQEIDSCVIQTQLNHDGSDLPKITDRQGGFGSSGVSKIG